MMTATINDAGAYETIRNWLETRCAIHYPEHKRDLLMQRLARVQRMHAMHDMAELARKVTVEESHTVQLAVMHAASTNHTYFFREVEVLDYFRQYILPTLARRDEIRLWSAACSTGDEVYTLAIMIAETLGLDALKRTQILGTDISAPVIERAEIGIYAARQLEHMPEPLRRKYMRPVGIEQFQVAPEIRAACTFRRMNLKAGTNHFRKSFQAIFCRNVLYYFSQEDQVAIVNNLANVTEPGGWLITSVTESVRDVSPFWQQVASGVSVRKEGR